jgi:tetratricopeptide (TPR) repeat protein
MKNRHSAWLRPTSGTMASLALCSLLAAVPGCSLGRGAGGPEAVHRGLAYEQRGNSYQAIVEYRRALDRDPKNTAIRLRLADLLLETHDWPSAEKHYRLVLRDDPANLSATNNYAWLSAIQRKNLDWAETAMKPIAARNSPQRHVFLDTLGMVYLGRRKYKEAKEAFQEAADLCRRGEVMSTSDECREINNHLREARSRE